MKENGKIVLNMEMELTYFIMAIAMSVSTDLVKQNLILGKPYGYGQYYWNNGSSYSGQFVDGVKQGFGRWRKSKEPNTNLYEGQYANDKKEGFGIFKWATGNIYIGKYKNDERNGIGQMIWTDGSMYIGEWKAGIQHGYGRMYFPDGTIKEGLFDKNVLKGMDGIENYDIPKDLLRKDFDIMKYADNDMQFSTEILKGLKHNGNTEVYNDYGILKRNVSSDMCINRKAFTRNGKNKSFIINSGKVSDNENIMETVDENPKRFKRKRFRKLKKLLPKGEWIPTGKPNFVNLTRVPGGI